MSPISIALFCLLQMTCPDRGSEPVRARWEPGPPLGCQGDPAAPAWYLFTPAHRQLVRRPGHRPGEARARARVLVQMGCTGLWFRPTAPVAVRTMGHVLDVEQRRCGR